jgi:hypothetical protein
MAQVITAVIAISGWAAFYLAAGVAIDCRAAWLDAQSDADHWHGVAERIAKVRSDAARRGAATKIHLAYSRDKLINEMTTRRGQSSASSPQ